MLQKLLPFRLNLLVPDRTNRKNSPPIAYIEKMEKVMALFLIKIKDNPLYQELLKSPDMLEHSQGFKLYLEKVKENGYTDLAMGTTPWGTVNDQSYFHGPINGFEGLSPFKILELDLPDDMSTIDQLKTLSYLVQNQWIGILYRFDDIIDDNDGIIGTDINIMKQFIKALTDQLDLIEASINNESAESRNSPLQEFISFLEKLKTTLDTPRMLVVSEETRILEIETAQSKTGILFIGMSYFQDTLKKITVLKDEIPPELVTKIQTPHTNYIELSPPQIGDRDEDHDYLQTSSEPTSETSTSSTSSSLHSRTSEGSTSPSDQSITQRARSGSVSDLGTLYKFIKEAKKYFYSAEAEMKLATHPPSTLAKEKENYKRIRLTSGAVSTVISLSSITESEEITGRLHKITTSDVNFGWLQNFITLKICFDNDGSAKELAYDHDPSLLTIIYKTYRINERLSDAILKSFADLLEEIVSAHDEIVENINTIIDRYQENDLFPELLKYIEKWLNLMRNGAELLIKSKRYYDREDQTRHIIAKDLETQIDATTLDRLEKTKPKELSTLTLKPKPKELSTLTLKPKPKELSNFALIETNAIVLLNGLTDMPTDVLALLKITN